MPEGRVVTAEKIGQHETQDWTVTIYSDGLVTCEHKRTGFREVRDVEELRRKLREKRAGG